MKEEFEITEKGRDIWGRKTFKVTKKSDNTAGSFLGYLFLAVLGLAILTLPSGIIALILYILLKLVFLNSEDIENLSEKKEKLAWGATITGIVAVAAYYYFYLDMSKMMGAIILACFLGGYSYYVLYKLVTWGDKTLEEKKEANKSMLRSIIVWGAFFLIYNYTNWFNFMKPMINGIWEGFIKPVIVNLTK